jgi:hypothetical protein
MSETVLLQSVPITLGPPFPPHFVRARNPDSIEEFVVLTPQRPSQEWRFTLMQPASITGRVVDDKDQPIPNLRLSVLSPDMVAGDMGIDVTTAADGSFTVKMCPQGRTSSASSPMPSTATNTSSTTPKTPLKSSTRITNPLTGLAEPPPLAPHSL